jgi:hypothetical protein
LQPLGYARWASLLVAANYVWSLIDHDRQFLQDRIARTRLVLIDPARRPSHPRGAARRAT